MSIDNYILTYPTLTKFTPLNPKVEDVHIDDIANSLSNKCRFTGLVNKFYSVAEHSLLTSLYVDPEYAFEALMHDATEAYLPDVATPVKVCLPGFKEIEARLAAVIERRFLIRQTSESIKAVKIVDNAILTNEFMHMFGVVPHECEFLTEPPLEMKNEVVKSAGIYYQLGIRNFTPEVIRRLFMRRFKELYKSNG